MTDKPNDGCNPETLSEHLAFREKMAQASRDCIRRNEEDMKRERDNELASLRAEVERLRNECHDKESEIQRLWERVKSLLSENAALRELVPKGYDEGLTELCGVVPTCVLWEKSTTKQRLEQINGEG